MTRRVWFARDAWLTGDAKVQNLGIEHGPAGVLVLEEMFALAKLENNRGEFGVRFSALAHRAFLKSAKQAEAIVGTCVSEGLIDLLGRDGPAFRARIPRWARWQIDDPTAADRQAKARTKSRESHEKVTALHRD